MKRPRNTARIPLLWLSLAASLFLQPVWADEYTDVSQLVRSGKYPEALTRADQFLGTQPRDPQMRFLRGVILRETGRTAEAVTVFTRLTEDYPELPEPYNNLAVLFAGQGQYDKARNALEQAIRTNPSYSTAHENLGDVYAKLASEAYNKALQLDGGAGNAVAPKLSVIKELFVPNNRVQKTVAPPAAAVPASPGPTTAPAPTPAAKPATPAPAPAAAPTPAPAVGTASAPAPATAKLPTPAPAAVAAAPTPAPATAPKPAAPEPAAANVGNKDVESAVRAWAAAWSSKDIKGYLGAYGKEFDPPGNMSRTAWEEERRARIAGKASISVKLENLAVSVNGGRATAKFRQDYKAGGLAVSSRKTLELQKSGDRWKIVRESVGG